jgi:hypothetical protein
MGILTGRKTMATSVYKTETIELFNGDEIVLRPLKISVLRDFMTKFDTLGEVADDNSDSMDVLVDCIAIAMRQYKPELSDKTKGGRENLEEELDLPTAYKIIEVAAGIKMGDDDAPKAQG